MVVSACPACRSPRGLAPPPPGLLRLSSVLTLSPSYVPVAPRACPHACFRPAYPLAHSRPACRSLEGPPQAVLQLVCGFASGQSASGPRASIHNRTKQQFHMAKPIPNRSLHHQATFVEGSLFPRPVCRSSPKVCHPSPPGLPETSVP